MDELFVNNIELIDLLDELRSIKLSADDRKYVIDSVNLFRDKGDLTLVRKREIRKIAYRHRVALKKLREAREKAKRTINLQRLGLSDKKATELVARKRAEMENRRNNRGF